MSEGCGYASVEAGAGRLPAPYAVQLPHEARAVRACPAHLGPLVVYWLGVCGQAVRVGYADGVTG